MIVLGGWKEPLMESNDKQKYFIKLFSDSLLLILLYTRIVDVL